MKIRVPTTEDLFIARFAYCHFDETHFPPVGGDRNAHIPINVRNWHSVPPNDLSHHDPHTQSELESDEIAHKCCNVPVRLTIWLYEIRWLPELSVPLASCLINDGDAGGGAILRDVDDVGESDPNGTYGSVRVAVSASVPTWKRGRPTNFSLMMRIHRMRLSLIILMSMSYLMHTCWMTESLW